MSLDPNRRLRKHSALLLLPLLLAGCGGPLGPLSGGELSGQELPAPPQWLGVDTTDGVQLETLDPAGDAHSVNTWATIIEGRLYIPTSLILGAEDPREREWVRNVLANDAVRVRATGTVYPGRMVRVADEAIIAAAKAALLSAYDEAASEHSAAAWVFEVLPSVEG
ncbi:MAG: hypothetical protein AAGI15_03200 [Pseudomonadota bacterium]